MQFVADLTWALMRPRAGTCYRILHAMQTPVFPVPPGLNKPTEVPSWLASGGLLLRRCILAVTATLLLPELSYGITGTQQNVGRTFWRSLRSHQSINDSTALRDRAASWDPVLLDVGAFY